MWLNQYMIFHRPVVLGFYSIVFCFEYLLHMFVNISSKASTMSNLRWLAANEMTIGWNNKLNEIKVKPQFI